MQIMYDLNSTRCYIDVTNKYFKIYSDIQDNKNEVALDYVEFK